MSRICLFALFLILSIIVRFGDCENNAINEDDNTNTDCVKNAPGSDETHLTPIEKILKDLKLPIDSINERKHTNGPILPGTLWCGDGDRAKNDNDLGHFNGTDACCRAHDLCRNDILAGDTKVNLKNNGIFTRSACTCDAEFYNCLKNVNSLIAKNIGKTYFNILQPQCFICVCPTDDCNPREEAECNNQCDKYQWVDNAKF
ncbi:phospholipase A2-like [Cataglyphis hispanica]|uniref:phospholipase A2-like n=1 Tax=Cataglyphis hispanica TaxID=1086592 RepID=UPI00217F8A57|nr:phospholipase A2-like [Cataglyphis hispanica]